MNRNDRLLPFGIPRNLGVIAIAMFVWGLGEGVFIFFLPLSLQRWNADAVEIGVVLSMIGVTMAVVQVPAGYLSDRFGSRLLILAALILGVASAAVMAAAHSQALFVAGLLAYGFTSLINPPLNSYITSLRGGWSVQRAMTFVSASFMVGEIIGPIFGGRIAETAGFPAVFRYSAGLFTVTTLMIFLAKHPIIQESQDSSIHKVNPLSNPRFIGLLAIVFITIVALSVPQQLTSLYLQDIHHLSIQQIGAMGTFASIGTAILMFSLGGLHAPTGMLLGQLLVAAFAFLMWRGQSAAVFFIGYLFVGGYRLYRLMALAFSRSLVKAGDTGLAYGLVETGNALAVIVAPLVAGFLYNYQPASVYTASLAALAITVILNALLLRQKQNQENIEDELRDQTLHRL